MSLTVKNLAQGLINAEPQDPPQVLYPYPDVASAKGALIKSIILSNVSASVDVKVYLKVRPGTGGDLYIAPVDLLIRWKGIFVVDMDITLSLASPQEKIVAWDESGEWRGSGFRIGDGGGSGRRGISEFAAKNLKM